MNDYAGASPLENLTKLSRLRDPINDVVEFFGDYEQSPESLSNSPEVAKVTELAMAVASIANNLPLEHVRQVTRLSPKQMSPLLLKHMVSSFALVDLSSGRGSFYRVQPTLCKQLLNTPLPNIPASALKFPRKCVDLSFPPGVLPLEPGNYIRSITLCYPEFSLKPGFHIQVLDFKHGLTSPKYTQLELDSLLSLKDTKQFIGHTPPYNDRSKKSLYEAVHIAFNLILYLTGNNSDVQIQEPGKKNIRKKSKRRNKTKPGFKPTYYLVGSRIEEECRAKTPSAGMPIHMVTGHGRWQACGPKWSEHKFIWIAPHVKGGKRGDPIPEIKPKTYKVV